VVKNFSLPQISGCTTLWKLLQNPAFLDFVRLIRPELVFGEILIRRKGNSFDLCHWLDRDVESLKQLQPDQVRALVQHTASGAFRPLKSAPNLQRGWRLSLADEPALEFVLNQFYPGAIADWHAAQSPPPPITNYRPFTERQTGMYRVTAMLEDEIARPMIRACCHKKFCLKQRLWSVDGLAPDPAPEKSLIPCLEPCAILLEFARKVFRITQEETQPPAPTEIEKRVAVAQTALASPDPAVRECGFDESNNPRRLQFVLEKYG